MSKKDKLIKKLLSSGEITIDELGSLMDKCGCRQIQRGKTSGSAIAYIHDGTGKKMHIHSPHPQKEIKPYVKDIAIEFLKDVGEINEK